MFPGLAEQLDIEDQREQTRFRALVLLCLLGFMMWWPIGLHELSRNSTQAVEMFRQFAVHVSGLRTA
ncbi:MAG: hypothetical protein JWM11_4830 [Planctomycetaceae bacterium]|nr:hypothetical protein [Planctomycetaceae bacterium]